MRNKQHSSKANKGHRSRQNQDDASRFADEPDSGRRPQDSSKSHSSSLGNDEIGGTSFDPGPVHSEEIGCNEETANKTRGTSAGTGNNK
jgi:hypothetical protein